MESSSYRLLPAGLEVSIRATPKAKQNRIVGFTPQGLKIQTTAAPEKGQANEAILALLATQCGVGKKSVHLLAGDTSQNKKILIEGDAEALLARLMTQN